MITEIIFLTILLEIITSLGRIFFGSMKEKYNKAKYKIRIHHGYIGLIFILIYFLNSENLFLILGISLFLSDFFHHFLILPLWIKRTEFP
mgnify:CR=1 FL=1